MKKKILFKGKSLSITLVGIIFWFACHLNAELLPGPFTVRAAAENKIENSSSGKFLVTGEYYAALPSSGHLDIFDFANNVWFFENKIKVLYNGYKLILPIADIGPQNDRDNYWDTDVERDISGAINVVVTKLCPVWPCPQ